MEINSVVKINYIDSETGKSFKTVPKQYKSSFNKLTLFRDEYKVFCEPIESLHLETYFDDSDMPLAIEWLKQELQNSVFDKIRNTEKVDYC